jgi:phosphomannomutase / phosphoglucomutase
VRLFGTNGIREVVGERLTAPFVTAVAGGIAKVIEPGNPVVVGWDGRTSSPALGRLVSATLALGGHRVIEVGLLPTPAVQYNVTKLGAQLGVILTASHNPPDFNGIKCIASDGLEVPRDVEERIEAAAAAGEGRAVPFDRIGEIRTDSHGAERYVDGILQQVDVPLLVRRKFTVVLDCGNGASVPTSPGLLRRLGCRVITLNGHVDGTFPGHLSEPTEANLVDLERTVPAIGADLGIAHDGDADRAVFVDANGRYVPGEQTLTLLAREFVRRAGGGTVVTPVSGSQSVEDVVKPLGGEVVYTRVGSPVVTREMLRRKAVFGGEENGGLIFPAFQLARDGAMTAAAILEYLARSGETLADALATLPKYALVKEKVHCPAALRDRVLEVVTAGVTADGSRVLTLDGLKIFREDGWVLLRPSGTEPLIRVFAEAKTRERAEFLANDGLERVRAAIRQLDPAAG